MKVSLSNSQATTQKSKLDLLIELLEKQENDKYEIAILCNDISENPKEWKNKGYNSLNELINNFLEPQYSIDRGYFYIYSHIGRIIKHFNLTIPEFRQITFSKLRSIAPFRIQLSDEQFMRLMETAKNMSFRELQKTLSKLNISSKKAPLVIEEDDEEEVEKPTEKAPTYDNKKEKREKEEELYEKEVDNFLKEKELESVFNTTNEQLNKEVSYKYLNLRFNEDVYNDVVAEALRIVEELTGYVDNERKMLYIFMDFIALHRTEIEKINQMKNDVERLLDNDNR